MVGEVIGEEVEYVGSMGAWDNKYGRESSIVKQNKIIEEVRSMQIKTWSDFKKAVEKKIRENRRYLKEAYKDWLKFAESAEKFKIYGIKLGDGLLGKVVPYHYHVGYILSREELLEFLEFLYEHLQSELVHGVWKNKYLSKLLETARRIGYYDYEMLVEDIDYYVGKIDYDIEGSGKRIRLEIVASFYEVTPSEEPGSYFDGLEKEYIEFVTVEK